MIRTSRWAALLARNALWTSQARLGGRLSLRLRPRLEDMADWWGEMVEGSGEEDVIGGEGGAESVEGAGCEGGSLRERWIDAG